MSESTEDGRGQAQGAGLTNRGNESTAVTAMTASKGESLKYRHILVPLPWILGVLSPAKM